MDNEENAFLVVAGAIQKQLLTKGDTGPAFPYIVRGSMSSRFFHSCPKQLRLPPHNIGWIEDRH